LDKPKPDRKLDYTISHIEYAIHLLNEVTPLYKAAPDMYEALSLLYKLHCEDAFRLEDKHYIAITKAAAALALVDGNPADG
jgi:hypothetical protein